KKKKKKKTPFLYLHQSDLLHQWCQLLCLCQHVSTVHREVGHYVCTSSPVWEQFVDERNYFGLITCDVTSVICELLLFSSTAVEVKQQISRVLVKVIAQALQMINWKPWKRLILKPATTVMTTQAKTSDEKYENTYGNDIYVNDSDDVVTTVQTKIESTDLNISKANAITMEQTQTKTKTKTDDDQAGDKRKTTKQEKHKPKVTLKTFETTHNKEKDGEQVLTINLFRSDRDRVSLCLPLSRFIVHFVAMYCQSCGQTFADVVAHIKCQRDDDNDNNNNDDNDDQKERESDINEAMKQNRWEKTVDKLVGVYTDQFMQIMSFVSQVNSGLWDVHHQNPSAMISNYINGGSISRLKQVDFGGLCQVLEYVKPAHFITKLIYFFQLHDWFAADSVVTIKSEEQELSDNFESGWMHWCNSAQTLRLSEELFLILIQFISEPKFRICHNTFSKYYCQHNLVDEDARWLEYEIIHLLACQSFSISELCVLSGMPLEQEWEQMDFTHILQRVAIREPPQDATPTKFRLKDEYFALVNPYFLKYSQRDRQRVVSAILVAIQHCPPSPPSLSDQTDSNAGHYKLSRRQWPTVEYSDERRLALLGTSWMAVMWTCTLHHAFVNDTTRFTSSLFVRCLRLVALAVE
ncbi:hypothetical protein RFI_18989, partial [Reticulomyxa filosa]